MPKPPNSLPYSLTFSTQAVGTTSNVDSFDDLLSGDLVASDAHD
ncbi:MAG TPA: hypothetical protein VNW47_07280 [Terriglobales bacterium]|nr:hypothetical protein [Terriglobales bacterium]